MYSPNKNLGGKQGSGAMGRRTFLFAGGTVGIGAATWDLLQHVPVNADARGFYEELLTVG